MVRNRHLARAIHDAGWGEFVDVLDWQARKAGHEVVGLDPRNTTRPARGAVRKPSTVSGWQTGSSCAPNAGLVEDRGRNAARNLNPDRRDKPGAGVDGA